MAIFPITSDDFETFSLTTNPKRSFISSSSGIVGSVNLYARRSHTERDSHLKSVYVDGKFSDLSVDSVIQGIQTRMVNVSGRKGYDLVDQYMNFVNILGTRDREKTLGITRIVPPVEFNKNTVKKLVTKDVLYNHYRATSPNMQWAYTNYHTLNFFSASCVSSSSVLLYPNVEQSAVAGKVSGSYVPSDAFSFDFYINPRYTSDENDGTFKAGTILHLSSCYAVSLISGSLKDVNGKTSAYRLLLQLSHSADVTPDRALPGTYPNDLIFMSDDNSLLMNHWHHVIIRWGGSNINQGSGSFNIDGSDAGFFNIPSSSVMPNAFTSKGNPDVLCVGNYYQGTNAGTSAQACYFATDPATREGLETLLSSTGIEQPASAKFEHPLNAELHDISIRSKYLTNKDIEVSQSIGPSSLDDTFMFYVPPFFTRNSPIRRDVNGFGGVLQTPFFAVDGSTNDPFNIAMSFGVAGFQVNLDNFLRDFVTNSYPRKLYLTASVLDSTAIAQTANELIYNDPNNRRANLMILPCDDGNFVPNYSLLEIEDKTKFVDSLGLENLSLITLDNLIDSGSKIFGTSFNLGSKTEEQANEMSDYQVGFTPEDPGASPGPAYVNFLRNSNSAVSGLTYEDGVQSQAPLTIYQRTLDSSSNQIVMFDVSNVLYGMQIQPGTLLLRDTSLSGSFGKISISIRDDGNGNLYRSDSITNCATWNSVGNVFYAEGLIVIKSPHLCLFGKDYFEIEFKGEQNIHVLSVDVLANANTAFSSSNVTYKNLPPSGYANDPDSEFVYVSNINLHDNNYNVIAKASLAQPIVKRRGEKIMFRLRFDF